MSINVSLEARLAHIVSGHILLDNLSVFVYNLRWDFIFLSIILQVYDIFSFRARNFIYTSLSFVALYSSI